MRPGKSGAFRFWSQSSFQNLIARGNDAGNAVGPDDILPEYANGGFYMPSAPASPTKGVQFSEFDAKAGRMRSSAELAHNQVRGPSLYPPWFAFDGVNAGVSEMRLRRPHEAACRLDQPTDPNLRISDRSRSRCRSQSVQSSRSLTSLARSSSSPDVMGVSFSSSWDLEPLPEVPPHVLAERPFLKGCIALQLGSFV